MISGRLQHAGVTHMIPHLAQLQSHMRTHALMTLGDARTLVRGIVVEASHPAFYDNSLIDQRV